MLLLLFSLSLFFLLYFVSCWLAYLKYVVKNKYLRCLGRNLIKDLLKKRINATVWKKKTKKKTRVWVRPRMSLLFFFFFSGLLICNSTRPSHVCSLLLFIVWSFFQTVDMTWFLTFVEMWKRMRTYITFFAGFFCRALFTTYSISINRIEAVYATVFPRLTHPHWCSPALFKCNWSRAVSYFTLAARALRKEGRTFAVLTKVLLIQWLTELLICI